MYLHLGQDVMAAKKSIIGIFDLDSSTVTQITRDFLAAAQRENQVENVSDNLPKSFIICADNRKKNRYSLRVKNRTEKKRRQRLYISPLASATLLKRSKTAVTLNV